MDSTRMLKTGDTGLLCDNKCMESLKVKTESGELEFRPLMCDTLNDEDRLKSRRELNETEDNVKRGLRKLRDFLTTYNLPSKMDDLFLLHFLRSQKFNVKKAEQKLKNYCNMMRELGDFIEAIDLDRVREALDKQVVGLLPYRDQHGRIIFFSRASVYNPAEQETEDLVRCSLVLIFFASIFPLTSVNGLCYIVEAKYTSTLHMFTGLSEWRKYFPCFKELPFRVRRIDIFKENWFYHYLYVALTTIMPLKMAKRVHLHGSRVEGLAEAFHPSILPYEFGGTMGPLSNESYRDRFLDYVEQFKKEYAYFKHSSKNQ